ncbi:acyl carrier protein [Alloacidobacterium dinghuense]|uniref:Acyl carrier protein n=1 Tax=Alloacidobacterium dinghuense TaxID=2763107 RepID=A0A7G8BLS9_9BACT|nr:acyl carrier protein [Alloacidobacterium dinghuense]QNI33499.1 acyl carrier protein [Alloacidobacterium dinghuense]
MSDQEQLLIRCFASIFPGLTEEEIQNASTDSVGIWDSLSTVTLASVIQEEFSLEIDPEILPRLDSFEAFHDYLLRYSEHQA